MAFKLFKNGDELYDDSQELIKRGEFDKARDYLIKSIEKEGGTDDVAAVQVALIDLSDRLSSMQAYQNLLTALERLTSATTIQFGLETIDVAAVCNPRAIGLVKDYIEGWVEPNADWE